MNKLYIIKRIRSREKFRCSPQCVNSISTLLAAVHWCDYNRMLSCSYHINLHLANYQIQAGFEVAIVVCISRFVEKVWKKILLFTIVMCISHFVEKSVKKDVTFWPLLYVSLVLWKRVWKKMLLFDHCCVCVSFCGKEYGKRCYFLTIVMCISHFVEKNVEKDVTFWSFLCVSLVLWEKCMEKDITFWPNLSKSLVISQAFSFITST